MASLQDMVRNIIKVGREGDQLSVKSKGPRRAYHLDNLNIHHGNPDTSKTNGVSHEQSNPRQ